MRLTNILAAALLALVAFPALSDERRAIIIGNNNYDNIRDVPDARDAAEIADRLRALGFGVTIYSDMNSRNMADRSSTILQSIRQGDRVLVFVAGHVTSTPEGRWLLATDAPRPAPLMPGQDAMSLDRLMAVMAEKPGGAVLLVGESSRGLSANMTLAPRFEGGDLPQGVTVFAGPADAVADFARNEVLVEGATYAAMADDSGRNISAFGYLSDLHGFLPVSPASVDAVEGMSGAEVELLFFERAEALNTEAAWRDFLERYPRGLYAARAQARLNALSQTPAERAEAEERSLSLSRNERREIQSNLTLLGYNTRGVDGIFGRGTRAAIEGWQGKNDLTVTGYLNRDQIARISRQAEGERKRVEAEDTEYWRNTGRLGTEAGYEAYLERYPNGLFSDLAKSELDRIAAARRAEQAAAESAAWDQARITNTAAAYRRFLESYPDGIHATDARQRLAEIEAESDNSAAVEAAKAQEQRALGNSIARLLAEQRLSQFGYDPGVIDGTFDRESRQAIRAFQRDAGITVTGYVDSATVARLLSGN